MTIPRARPHWRWLSVLLLLTLHMLAPRLSAQDDSAARERAARAAFEAGVEAAQVGDYEGARALFMRSRQLVVKASTLLNLALADLKLGLVDEALLALDALDALDASTAGPEHERIRQRARQLRAEAESLRASTEEPERAAAPEPAAAAQLDEPNAVAEATSAQPAPTVRPAALQQARREPASLSGPRTLLIVSGALAVGAIGSALWWHDRSKAVDACQPGGGRVCMQQHTLARQQTAGMALTLALGTSALGLATGGAIWLVRRKRDTRTTLSAWASPHSLGLTTQRAF